MPKDDVIGFMVLALVITGCFFHNELVNVLNFIFNVIVG